MSKKRKRTRTTVSTSTDFEPGDPKATEPDWGRECEACGAKPVVPVTGLCGPCTFGEAETAGGNW